MTNKQLQKYKEQHRIYNRDMKSQNKRHMMLTFEQYMGMYVKGKKSKNVKGNSKLPNYNIDDRCSHIPSAKPSYTGALPRAKDVKYTGTLIKGISTMHKSNAVPIIDDEEAKSHAHMRR